MSVKVELSELALPKKVSLPFRQEDGSELFKGFRFSPEEVYELKDYQFEHVVKTNTVRVEPTENNLAFAKLHFTEDQYKVVVVKKAACCGGGSGGTTRQLVMPMIKEVK